jgi:hypothetical protein
VDERVIDEQLPDAEEDQVRLEGPPYRETPDAPTGERALACRRKEEPVVAHILLYGASAIVSAWGLAHLVTTGALILVGSSL